MNNRFFEFFRVDYFDPLIDVSSSYASDIDGLIFLVLVVVGFWFLVAEGVFLWFIMKFRARDGRRADYIDGKNKKHKRWITVPHLLVLGFDVLIIVVSFNVWYKIKMDLPENPDCHVRVIGQQWAWTFQHAGADCELDTADDIFTVDELHVENNKVYHFELQATDVLHSFSVPVWRIKQDAIPGRSITGWFQPTEVGRIRCPVRRDLRVRARRDGRAGDGRGRGDARGVGGREHARYGSGRGRASGDGGPVEWLSQRSI